MVTDGLTDRQREVLAGIRPGEPMAWLVIHRDGWTSVVKLDRARAEQYAGQQHGVLLPLCVPADELPPPIPHDQPNTY
jgi:hypothetical protein